MANHMTVNTLRQPPQPPQGTGDKEGEEKLMTHLGLSSSGNGNLESSNHRLGPATSFFNTVDNSQTLELRPSANSSSVQVTQFVRLKSTSATPYPSSSSPGLEHSPPSSGKRSFNGFQHGYSQGDMLPPRQISPRYRPSTAVYVDHGYKRTRLSPVTKATNQTAQYLTYGQHDPSSKISMGVLDTQRSGISSPPQTFTPSNGGFVPPSPATSSVGSDESQQSTPKQIWQQQPDRRMSIESLISGSSYAGSNSEGALSEQVSNATNSTSPRIKYGLDAGYPDFDVPYNEDTRALQGTAPTKEVFWCVAKASCQPKHEASTKQPVTQSRPFYKSPIEVRIPEELEPLPGILLDHPMNMLYFHHFINHTARILVPHDCSGNPFRKILPRSEYW